MWRLYLRGTVMSASKSRQGAGRPLLLALDAIDEDPEQPRRTDSPGFSGASLRELAASIRRRGVKTPISVRQHPSVRGRYIINHGARRYRAARVAGLNAIPAFIDNDYNDADQVIENLHRNDLTAREIADYIGRELARGLRRKDIAERVSKSAAYITQHAALLDLPESIAAAFNAGRVRDVTLVGELLLAHKAAPQVVAAWLTDPQQEVTRGTVRTLRDFLADAAGKGSGTPGFDSDGTLDSVAPLLSARASRQQPFHGTLTVRHGGRVGELLLRRRPSTSDVAWVRHADGERAEVALADLRLVQWTGF